MGTATLAAGKVARKRKGKAQPSAAALLAWYDRHRRVLPWRAKPGEASDPYRVWLSEIMLQQTTVKTVGPYFENFLMRFASVDALAAASLDDVLKLWSGLGYYARARNLHACAIAVSMQHDGKFPDTEDGLRELPGVGPYTAAAIAAIAFDRKASPVDGNIERVIARLCAVEEALPASKPTIRKLADALTPEQRAGDFAQAMMDLGASICTPKKPACALCPFDDVCIARARGDAETFPRKTPKASGDLRKGAVFVALRADGHVLTRRRPEKGLLGGLVEFPTTEWTKDFAAADSHTPLKAAWQRRFGVVRHVFTHFPLELTVYAARVSAGIKAPTGMRFVPLDEIEGEALPTLMRKVLTHANIGAFSGEVDTGSPRKMRPTRSNGVMRDRKRQTGKKGVIDGD
jgi:A/G-specific adenine glycosylase